MDVFASIYYGFIGVAPPGGEPEYTYNLPYKKKLMRARLDKLGDTARLHLNPAFRPVLDIAAL